jgi:hypothetical protein
MSLKWSPEEIVEDFITTASLASLTIKKSDIQIDKMLRPNHRAPTKLQANTMAIYVFSYKNEILKVGKAGPKSQARYCSQHYNPKGAKSSLALSILEDSYYYIELADRNNPKLWIQENTDRVNFLLSSKFGIGALNLFESFTQCRLRPRYEGVRRQDQW